MAGADAGVSVGAVALAVGVVSGCFGAIVVAVSGIGNTTPAKQ